jgi:hypothetical protein
LDNVNRRPLIRPSVRAFLTEPTESVRIEKPRLPRIVERAQKLNFPQRGVEVWWVLNGICCRKIDGQDRYWTTVYESSGRYRVAENRHELYGQGFRFEFARLPMKGERLFVSHFSKLGRQGVKGHLKITPPD